MKINIGDKVRFLNDVGEAKVIKLIDKNTVLVLNDDDFEIPVLNQDLIVIESAVQQNIPEINTNNYVKEQEIEQDIEVSDIQDIFSLNKEADEVLNVYFAIKPIWVNEILSGNYELFLINDSGFSLLYSFSFVKNGLNYFVESDKLEDNTKILLQTISQNQFNDFEGFNFQLIAHKFAAYPRKSVCDKTIKLQAVKLFKENVFQENDFFDEKALIYSIAEKDALEQSVEKLSDEDVKKIVINKERFFNPNKKNEVIKQKKEFENTIVEVDLHINELIDNHIGLGNSEILEIQLNHFKKELEKAISQRVKKIVFIHGLGNGVLKVKLRALLDLDYKNVKYQDASFQEYGYGATMVHIR